VGRLCVIRDVSARHPNVVIFLAAQQTGHQAGLWFALCTGLSIAKAELAKKVLNKIQTAKHHEQI